MSSSPAPPPRKEKVTLENLAASTGKDYLHAWKEKQSEIKTSGWFKCSVNRHLLYYVRKLLPLSAQK